MIVTMRKPIDKAAIIKDNELYGIEEARELAKVFKPEDKRPLPTGKTDAPHYVGRHGTVLEFVGDRTFVVWVKDQYSRIPETLPGPLELLGKKGDIGPLSEGIALAVEQPVALAINASGIKTACERDPAPEEFMSLFKAVSIAGYAKLNKDTADVTVVAKFAGPPGSTDAEGAAKKLKEMAVLVLTEDANRTKQREGDSSTFVKLQQLLVKMTRDSSVKLNGNNLSIRTELGLGAETKKLLSALPGSTAVVAGRAMGRNNLKQIALAFHHHHDLSDGMPANTYDKDGKPLLSWRVHILPYIGQKRLYNQFKLDESWDSVNNKKLIEKMPKLFAMPGVKTKEPGATFYRAFTSKKGAAVRALMMDGESKGGPFQSITDGMSNTYLCVEAEEPCIWTKPDDLPFDPDSEMPTLGGHYSKDRFTAAFLDGSVRTLNARMPIERMKAHITANGGEPIGED